MKRRTQELAIPIRVKEAVAERDSVGGWPCCILCGKPAPTGNALAFSNAHYIARSQGGLGIEENILTLCTKCHWQYDTTYREPYKPLLRRYLREHYDGWSEYRLTYKKGGTP